MRTYVAILLLLLTALTTQAQDTTARYRSTLSAYERELVPVPRVGGGLLTYVVSRLGVSPLYVDTSAIYNWASKFVTERAFLASRLSSERDYQEGRYRRLTDNVPFVQVSGRPTYYPTDTNNVIGLAGKFSRYATNERVNQIVSGSGDSSKTAYPKSVSDNRYPLASDTKLALLARAPGVTLASLRSTPAASLPTVFYALDKDKAGLYFRDPLDTSSPDDSATTIVAADGGRYKWYFEGYANARRWGVLAKNTNVTDTVAMKRETAILQRAIDYVVKAANPAQSGSTNPNRDRPATLYVPAGTHYLWGGLTINGALRMSGDGGLSYSGTLLFQVKDHVPIFSLGVDTDGGSNCFQLENIRLRAGTPGGATASTISVPASSTFGSHSLHLREVWFQNWEKNAIDIKGNADDFQVHNCVFDGTQGGPALSLGSANRIVANASILGNTFYDCKNGAIEILQAKNTVVSANRAYATTYVPPYFINSVVSGALSLSGLTVTGNSINDHGPILITQSGGFSITGNTYTNARNSVLVFDGGGVSVGGSMSGNTITGVFSVTAQAGPDLIYGAPVRAYGTGVQGFSWSANSVQGLAPSYMTAYLPDSRNGNNSIDLSGSTGFSLPSIIANPIGSLTRGIAYTGTVSTASWTSGAYTTLVPPGTLQVGQTYLLRLYYTQPGSTEIAQSYLVPIVATYAGANATGPALNGNSVNYNLDGKQINLRYVRGNGAVGLEATTSASGMSGTLQFTLSYQ